MEKTFNAQVNGSYNFQLTEEQINSFDVASLDNEHFHIIQDNQSYRASITDCDFQNRAYEITINNTVYKVKIENELDQLIKEMGFEVGKAKQINAIKAPMPGLILDIAISIGQEVNEGDNLLILEAMKMENSFYSPRHGIIKSIAVEKGQAVDKGQLLIEFE